MSKIKLITRVDKNRDYTPIINAVFRDTRLSWGAKGIMGYALTKPDDWSLRVSDVVNQGPDGKAKVTAYFKELRVAGYFEYTRIYEKGKIVAAVYKISEKPSHNNPLIIETEHERRKKKKLKLDSPVLVSPVLDNPALENLPLLSNDIISTDLQSTELRITEEEELTKNPIEKEVVSELRKIIEKNSSSPNTKFNSGNRIKLQDLLTKHSKQELLAAVYKLIDSPNFHQWSIGGILQYVTDFLYSKKPKQDCVVNKLFTEHKLGQFDGTANTILGN